MGATCFAGAFRADACRRGALWTADFRAAVPRTGVRAELLRAAALRGAARRAEVLRAGFRLTAFREAALRTKGFREVFRAEVFRRVAFRFAAVFLAPFGAVFAVAERVGRVPFFFERPFEGDLRTAPAAGVPDRVAPARVPRPLPAFLTRATARLAIV